jgi:membrane-associated phospholipid phosphatase
MAADRHYLTDVLTGAVVGGAIGYLVPVLFHGREDGGQASAVSLWASPAAAGITIRF